MSFIMLGRAGLVVGAAALFQMAAGSRPRAVTRPVVERLPRRERDPGGLTVVHGRIEVAPKRPRLSGAKGLRP